MSSEGYIKLEAFTWKKVSHGLFDYDNKDYLSINTKIAPDSWVIARISNSIKSFSSFRDAISFQLNHAKSHGKDEADQGTSLLWCLIKDKGRLRVYSFNQLKFILELLPQDKQIEEVDSDLQQVFRECCTVQEAREDLFKLSAEPFSADMVYSTISKLMNKIIYKNTFWNKTVNFLIFCIWRVAKTLDWLKLSKYRRIEAQGVEIQEGSIIKMGRMKMKVKKLHISGDQVNGK